ncbi:BBF_collapsed_G0018180.mRNA.1.CDS.1 [Saccharomyces cerevisiae]|nr:BBF_collapsed_G0018180.mRNA.1.CDS.1 [Saccharomyces cerevisiae]
MQLFSIFSLLLSLMCSLTVLGPSTLLVSSFQFKSPQDVPTVLKKMRFNTTVINGIECMLSDGNRNAPQRCNSELLQIDWNKLTLPIANRCLTDLTTLQLIITNSRQHSLGLVLLPPHQSL